MKKSILTIVLALFITILANSQQSAIRLTFTAENNNTYVQLGEIKVINRTQEGDTTLYYPDTVLVLNYVGINDNPYKTDGFILNQNHPNPVIEKTKVDIYIPEEDKVNLTVSDIFGRRIINSEHKLVRGNHSFIFSAGSERVYFLTATWREYCQSIKIIHSGANYNSICSLDYSGYHGLDIKLKSEKGILGFSFTPGDTLRYIGYATTLAGALGSDLIDDNPQSDNTYLFEITEGMPCPDIQSVTYQGKTYNTVLIDEQCWFKENLNVGIRVNGSNSQMDNGIIEKYCYDDLESNCDIYGGLYQWDEAKQYILTEGVKGICPEGWHIPTDGEWGVLVDFLGGSSLAGGKMKETGTEHWTSPNAGATNESGFTALPGGFRNYTSDNFYNIGNDGRFWSSSQSDASNAWARYMSYASNDVGNYYYKKTFGFSIRCLQNE